jgi:hypothetical protein
LTKNTHERRFSFGTIRATGNIWKSSSIKARRIFRTWYLILFLVALPSAAELVVFSSGHVLKVESYQVSGKTLSLVLPASGQLTVPLSVVERIVSDEIVPEPAEIVSSRFALSFRDSAGVPGTPFGELIYETARRHELNPELIAAMVRAESAFDPEAVSVKGARGLLQLMPATAMRFGVPPEALFEPRENLDAGVRYLKWLVERYPGDLPKILSAYNAGEGSVDRYGGVPPFRETRDYIRRIYSELGMDSTRSGAR